MREQTPSPKDTTVGKAVKDIYTLLNRDGGPETFIPLTLEYLQGTKKSIVQRAWQVGPRRILSGVWQTVKGVAAERVERESTGPQSRLEQVVEGSRILKNSIQTFASTLTKDPAAILLDENFVEIVKMPALWTTIGNQSNEVASLVVSKIGLSNEGGNTTTQISELVKDFSGTVDVTQIDKTVESLGVLATFGKQDDQKKTGALVDLFEKATSDTALKLLQQYKQLIGKLAQNYMPAGLDAEKILDSVLTQETFTTLKQVVDTKTIESLLVLTSATEKDDQKKESALVYLAEKATSTASLQLLLPYKQILIEQAKKYLPVEMDAEKILDGILTAKAFSVLNKAIKEYKYHQDNGNKTFGLLKAVAIVVAYPKLARITTHVLWRSLKTKLLNLVPDFVRRIHSNDILNDILSKRGDNKDLKNLCAPGIEINLITRHTLGSRCFKGLDIPHHLDNLVISGFDFKRATLGMTNDEAQSKGKEVNFSFANSVISKSDFKDVTFVGPIIDLSGMQIDAESFNSLLPALQKAKLDGKEIKIDHNIKIKGEVQDIASKMEGLDCKGKFIPVESLDTASKEKSSQKPENNPSKSKPDKGGPSLG